jgi:LAO/AO transport system kinase
LAQAITLIESTRDEHRDLARQIVGQLLLTPPAQPTLRVAVTGAPGAGKSTFIEALGMHLIELGLRVAVLAIDPSSSVSGGSILGDKTRMEQLSIHPMAFIRPSPAGDSLGGVARKTRETIVLVESAGYDVVLIETVGVGQSEVAAQRMSDLFLLLLLPGAGDELQGIKRGIVEMADLLVVNKADGERIALADQARVHYATATHLLPIRSSGWSPRVLTCSALTINGIREVWQAIEAYRTQVTHHLFLEKNRREQARFWFREALDEGLRDWFFGDAAVANRIDDLEQAVQSGSVSPFEAAQQLLAMKVG